MTTYRVYVSGYCFTVDLTENEYNALINDGLKVEVAL